MKFRILVAILAALIIVSCGQKAQVKYAQDLYKAKAYAEAIEMVNAMKSPTEEAYTIAGNSQYQLRNMGAAVSAYEKAGTAVLSDSDKIKYAEALKEMGDMKKANQIMNSIFNKELYKDEIAQFANASNLIENKIKIETLIAEKDWNEALPFYYNDSLFYLTNYQEKFSPKSNFRYDNKPFVQITSKTAINNQLKALNTEVNDGPVCTNSYTVIFNRSVASNKDTPAHIALFEKSNETLTNKKATQISFCNDSLSYMHPAFRGSSNQLVFVSNHNFETNSKENNFNIYITSKDFVNGGEWETPKPISTAINSKYDELFPTFLNDSILAFASQRPNGLGGLDIYTSTLNKNGTWSAPRLMPAPLNSSFDDFHLISDRKQKNSYFISSNREGSDDIFSVNLPDNLKGQWKIELIHGKTVQPLANFPMTLQTEVGGVDKISILTNNDGTFDGIQDGGINTVSANFFKTTQITYPEKEHSFFTTTYQTIALLPIEKWMVSGIVTDSKSKSPLPGVEVLIEGTSTARSMTNEFGYFETTLEDLNETSLGQLTLTLRGYEIKKLKNVNLFSETTQIDLNKKNDLALTRVIQIGDNLSDLLKLDPIYFEYAKFDITSQGASQLDKIVEILKSKSNLVIECGSHTDCIGSASINQNLSNQRAKATADYLISHGVNAKQITYKGFGETKPITDCECDENDLANCDEEKLALNRRTEFRVIKDLDPERTKKDQETILVVKEKNFEKIIAEKSVGVEPDNILKWLDSGVNEFEMDPKIKSKLESNPYLPKKIFFTVQIGAFSENVKPEFYSGLFPVFVEKDEIVFTRICTGKFTNYESAEQALIKLLARYPDAFIAAYKGGKRVPVQEAHKE
jgi:outer membrane protein OmpA-like peptidoglycan-associated protein